MARPAVPHRAVGSQARDCGPRLIAVGFLRDGEVREDVHTLHSPVPLKVQRATPSNWAIHALRSCPRQNVAIRNRLESELEPRRIVASIVRECGSDDFL